MTSGKITSNYIGTTVKLSNSAIACQEWIIADVNHDNTSGTVDLFSKTTLNNSYAYIQFGSNNYIYKGSDLDTYLESTVYNGFSSSIKSALNLMNVVSNEETIQRHVVAPSVKEVGNSLTDGVLQEGTIYPIFSPASKRNYKSIRKTPIGDDAHYWTRSREISGSYTHFVWVVDTPGDITSLPISHGSYVVARIRFAKA